MLGFDLSNRSLLAKNYPIIGNRAAIAINQAWGGHACRPSEQLLFALPSFTNAAARKRLKYTNRATLA